MSNEFKDWYNDFSEEQKKNYELCMKYPILIPHNRWFGTVRDDYNYEYTELDGMPEGWLNAFGLEMIAELQDAINKIEDEGQRERVRIMDIKEKWGFLHFYLSCYNDEIQKVVNKYEKMSERICIKCGKPATRITTGWISPYCDECLEEFPYPTMDIDEFYKQWEDEDEDD